MSNHTNGPEIEFQDPSIGNASKFNVTSVRPLDPEKSSGLADQTNYVPRRQIISIFLACSIVEFVSLLDGTMVAVGLNIIANDLGGGKQVAWVSTSFFVYVYLIPQHIL